MVGVGFDEGPVMFVCSSPASRSFHSPRLKPRVWGSGSALLRPSFQGGGVGGLSRNSALSPEQPGRLLQSSAVGLSREFWQSTGVCIAQSGGEEDSKPVLYG